MTLALAAPLYDATAVTTATTAATKLGWEEKELQASADATLHMTWICEGAMAFRQVAALLAWPAWLAPRVRK